MKQDLTSVDPDTILGHIANGGSISGLAKLWQCTYKTVHAKLLEIDPNGTHLANAIKIAETRDKDLITQTLRSSLGSSAVEAYNEDGTLKPLDQWPEELQASLTGIDIEERYDPKTGNLQGTSKKVKFTDKLKAIELLGRERNMFNKTKVEVEVSLEALVAESWKDDASVIEATHVVKSDTDTPPEGDALEG